MTHYSDPATPYGASELEKLIKNLEFENQQVVKLIEKENQVIEALEKEECDRKSEMAHLQEKLSHFDEDTKKAHKQFTLNRDHCESLQKTETVLMEHELALNQKLNSLKYNGEVEKKERENILKEYQNIYMDYENKYKTFPLVKEYFTVQEEIARYENKIAEEEKSLKILQQQIEEERGSDEINFNDLNEFIIKIAQMKLDSEKVNTQIKLFLYEKNNLEKELSEIREKQTLDVSSIEDIGEQELCERTEAVRMQDENETSQADSLSKDVTTNCESSISDQGSEVEMCDESQNATVSKTNQSQQKPMVAEFDHSTHQEYVNKNQKNVATGSNTVSDVIQQLNNKQQVNSVRQVNVQPSSHRQMPTLIVPKPSANSFSLHTPKSAELLVSQQINKGISAEMIPVPRLVQPRALTKPVTSTTDPITSTKPPSVFITTAKPSAPGTITLTKPPTPVTLTRSPATGPVISAKPSTFPFVISTKPPPSVSVTSSKPPVSPFIIPLHTVPTQSPRLSVPRLSQKIPASPNQIRLPSFQVPTIEKQSVQQPFSRKPEARITSLPDYVYNSSSRHYIPPIPKVIAVQKEPKQDHVFSQKTMSITQPKSPAPIRKSFEENGSHENNFPKTPRNEANSSSESTSPFDLDRHRQQLEFLRAKSPGAPIFTSRPMFETETSQMETHDDVEPGSFFQPFHKEQFEESGGDKMHPSNSFKPSLPATQTFSQENGRDRHQEVSPTKKSSMAPESVFDNSPESKQTFESGFFSLFGAAQSSPQREDSGFSFSFGGADTESSQDFSFSFGENSKDDTSSSVLNLF